MTIVPRVTIVDERDLLLPLHSIDELVSAGSQSGRFRLLAGYRIGRQSDFSEFIGDPGGDSIPDWWACDPAIHRGEVQIYRLDRGYLIPRLGVLISENGKIARSTYTEAAVLMPHLWMLPKMVRNDDGSIALSLPGGLPKLSGINVTLPSEATSSYGHFVLDCLPAVSVLLQAVASRPFVFPLLAHWQRRHLALMGVNPIELTEEIYEVEDVVYTSCMDQMLHISNTTVVDVRNRQLRRRGVEPISPPVRIYLGRTENENDMVPNESTLESALRDDGFMIFRPDQMSVDSQISLFENASIVLGFTNPGFANIIYCRRGTEVIEIRNRDKNNVWVRNLAILMQCRWCPFFFDDKVWASDLAINDISKPDLECGEPMFDVQALRAYVSTKIFDSKFPEIRFE